MKKIVLILLACMLMVTMVSASADEDDRVITVSGNATVSLSADFAEVQIGVNTRSESIQEAQRQNAQAIADVLTAIYALGVEEKDVITSSFNVYTESDYSSSLIGRQTEKVYYKVSNMLHVVIRDISKAGQVLDAAIAAGANQSYGITFGSTQENEAYHKALTRAYEDAQKKAQTLAAAAGKTLGDVMSINASQGGYGYGVSNVYAASKEMAADTAIIGGDITVNAGVTVTWSFR